MPLQRRHAEAYHEPLLLSTSKDVQVGSELLEWYQRVSKERGMPWRKEWIDPGLQKYQGEKGQADLRELLKVRAYEVWISEIMLQQTRVQTVIEYWNAWTKRWPTIEDLAAASPEDVLSAWRGLGYYSRATRIHQAAQAAVESPDLAGLLPSTAAELQKQVAGVGRYTAGAISSIAFGHAEAILDGNVARVLSRQLGFYADPKKKATTDLLWSAAQRLVEAVAGFRQDDEQSSDKPGFWNQALMELGSTLCTPTAPRCGECPIKSTCRAYGEGETLAVARGQLKEKDTLHKRALADQDDIEDVEDLCKKCEPMPEDAAQIDAVKGEGVSGKRPLDSESQPNGSTKRKASGQQSSLLAHFKKTTATSKQSSETPVDDNSSKTNDDASVASQLKPSALSAAALATIQAHVRQYPLKVVKAKVREEECVVCIIERRTSSGDSSSTWLLEQRPDKGLLASLWEFPSLTLSSSLQSDGEEDGDDDDEDEPKSKAKKPKKKANGSSTSNPSDRLKKGTAFSRNLLKASGVESDGLRNVSASASLVHVFSHLKLTMHIQQYVVEVEAGDTGSAGTVKPKRKWCTAEEVEAESMGTGMRRCWEQARGGGDVESDTKQRKGTTKKQKK